MKAFLVGTLLLIATNASAWSLFGPANQEECLVDKLKGTSETDTVARQQIFKYCYEKFKGSEASAGRKCVTRDLTPSERGLLQFTAGTVEPSMPYFTTNLYNGNDKTEITAMNIVISSPNFKSPQEYEMYVKMPIGPMTSGEVGRKILEVPIAGWSFKPTTIQTCD